MEQDWEDPGEEDQEELEDRNHDLVQEGTEEQHRDFRIMFQD